MITKFSSPFIRGSMKLMNTQESSNKKNTMSSSPQHHHQQEEFNIEDYECALCLKLLVDPVATPCGHTFCRFCLQQSIDASIRENRNSLLQCPLCRSPTLQHLCENTIHVLKPNVILVQLLSNIFPIEYKQRVEEVKQDFEEYNRTEIINESVFIGNTHVLKGTGREDGNIHQWTFFIRMDNEQKTRKYIDKVVIELHPTFHPSKITLTEPPYAVRRLGWGVFVIRAQIFWKAQYHKSPEKYTWMLTFRDDGDFTSHDIQFVTRKSPNSQSQNPDAMIPLESPTIEQTNEEEDEEDEDWEDMNDSDDE
jgi:hypothetical protein